MHKKAVLKARLKPSLEEAYAIKRNIEHKLVTLQAMQQKLQVVSVGVVTKQTVEDVKQTIAQCTAKVAVIWVALEGLRTKISAPTE